MINSNERTLMRHLTGRTRILGLFPLFVLSCLPLVVTADLGAQPATLPLDRFIGTWSGNGTLMGADAEFVMTWEWVLDQRFVRLSFQNSVQGSDGERRVFRAQAFYKPEKDAELSGTWFDSRGVVLPLKASAGPDTLTTQWGTPETEQGRTVYRLADEDRMEVEDFVSREGEWRRFGHATYERQVEK